MNTLKKLLISTIILSGVSLYPSAGQGSVIGDFAGMALDAVGSNAGKPTFDPGRFLESVENWAKDAENWIKMAEVGYDQYNAIKNSNNFKEYLYNSVGAFVYYSPEFSDLINETEHLARMGVEEKDYISNMLKSGKITPYEAEQMYRNLYEMIDASGREWSYVKDIVLDYHNTLSQKDRKKAVGDAARKMFGYRFEFMTEKKAKKTKDDAFQGAKSVYDAANGFYATPDAATSAAAEAWVNEKLGGNVEAAARAEEEKKEQDLDNAGLSVPGKKSRKLPIGFSIAYTLIGIFAAVYIPYNLYKRTKGERQSQDTLLKVVAGLAIGVALLEVIRLLFFNGGAFNLLRALGL